MMSDRLPNPEGLKKVVRQILGSIRGLKFNVTVDQESLIVNVDITQGDEKLETENAYQTLLNLETVVKPYKLRI